MSESEFLKVYDSQSEAYREAFKVFLQHTDQKVNARAWLERFTQSLPQREVFIDAGAGTGQLTSWIAHEFERTIAIEPNAYLREEFKKNFPDCQLLSGFITETMPPEKADLVVCSHVFYYIDPAEWMLNLETLVSWLKPEGVVLVILQNPQTDYNRMMNHFLGKHFDLAPLGEQFQRKRGKDFSVKVDIVHAHFTAPDFRSAYTVVEFMLNLFTITNPLSLRELEEYISKHFRGSEGGYRFSCHQDILQIQRKR